MTIVVVFFYKLLYGASHDKTKIKQSPGMNKMFRVRVFKRTQPMNYYSVKLVSKRGEKMGKRNRGYITVEACLVVPLFLFFMLSISGIFMLLMAEAHIHQSLAEAAGYTAQYAYLEKKLLKNENEYMGNIGNQVVLAKQFNTYLGSDFYVEKMILNGTDGIVLTISKDKENKKILIAKARYLAGINLPVLGDLKISLSNEIKQKAFLGYSKEEKSDCYVYVTPEQSVYHTTRSCTHLSLSVQKKNSAQKGNYAPCGFCGDPLNDKGSIYVSRTGNVYHYRAGCSGLKRTVRRVKIEEVAGLGPCSRCGR